MLRLGLLAVISLLLAPAAFSQTVARKPLPTEPLEKYDNPPAIAAPVLRISPALVSTFGPYTSYQVNVDASGNNRVGDAANEPSICVDRNNRNRMSIGWRQFNSVASNFRQAGFAYTTNGGTRWIAPGVLLPIPMLEHGWKQLRRQTIHSINRRRIDLVGSDQHSEFPCVGHIGRRFGGQPFYWWREFEHWSDLVCSLHKRKERRCSSDV